MLLRFIKGAVELVFDFFPICVAFAALIAITQFLIHLYINFKT